MSSPESPGPQEKLLVWVLRLGGAITCLAIPTALLTADQMAATHAWLGLGEFPARPVTLYMARSLSLMYGFHGVLLLAISTDVRRYRKLVVVLAWGMLGLGPALLAVDLAAGLPPYWTLAEGPPVALTGAAMLWLVRSVPRT